MISRFFPLVPRAGLALFAVLASVTATAADRWYEVEVLVFAHNAADARGEQPVTRELPDLADALPAPGTALALQNAGVDYGPNSLRLSGVPESEYKLQTALRALARSRAYRPILHTGWRQAIGNSRSSFKVRLAGGKQTGTDDQGNPLAELDGFLRLSLTPLLRAELDLRWQPPLAPAPGSTDQNWKIDGAATANGVFSLSASRRIKSHELHYFDHPMFSVLLELRPLEPEQADAETATEK